jgi:GNAT superfamily N-acetyltransferase
MRRAATSLALVDELERCEIESMADRMTAIQERTGNPEGVEIAKIGGATCFYSRTMPWPAFNTVKGLRNEGEAELAAIVDFYRERERKPQFELVPGLADPQLMRRLSGLGFGQTGFHATLYADLSEAFEESNAPGSIYIRELDEDEYTLYGTLHCRGTGLPDNGIAPVAANNRVLHERAGWKLYLALWEDEPAGVGVMRSDGRSAVFTFAATLPEHRGNGIHRELLLHRMRQAKLQGCRFAVSQCAFQSQSHRNMEQTGMRIGYVRASWGEA